MSNSTASRILSMLNEYGSTSDSEIMCVTGSSNPDYHIYILRKLGLKISEQFLWSDEKVYFFADSFNISSQTT